MSSATLRDASYIAANMREQDRIEIGAVVDLPPEAIAATLLASSPEMAWCASLDGQPVAIAGLAIQFDHILSGWAYGTDRMVRVIPSLTRFLLSEIAPQIVACGYRRVEVRTMASHDLSHKWLMGMGAVCETPEPYEYGRRGEMFQTYAWTRTKWMNADVLWRRRKPT